MDSFDRNILRLVQRDNRLTAEQLSERVGLSPAACHRRLKRLRVEGVVTADVAVVAPEALGREMTMVVEVTLERERIDLFDAFKETMRNADEVMQCYYVTGTTDFIVILTAKDMKDYDEFSRRYFFGNPNIRRFQTNVVMDTVKRGLAVPVDE